MCFMRGKYVLDEVGNGTDELKFRRGGKTILTIYIYNEYFDFLIILGKAECELFEKTRSNFPKEIQAIYNNSKTYHDGKWMKIPVSDLKTLESVKQMILIKKKPNRKPFPQEQAIYSNCGHRCDLCVHFTGDTISESFRTELEERVRRVYSLNYDAEFPPCNGCSNGGITEKFDCDPQKCAIKKGFPRCIDCIEFTSCKPQAGLTGKIESKSILADDITWAILPYVHKQYGN